MLKIYLDSGCDCAYHLMPAADRVFLNFDFENIDFDGIYVISYLQLIRIWHQLEPIVNQGLRVVLDFTIEGSDTIRGQARSFGFDRALLSGRMLVIGGGDMGTEWPCLRYDTYSSKVIGFSENYQAQAQCSAIYTKTQKPHSFLCLNGRSREHRAYTLEQLHQQNMLDHALWTTLSPTENLPVKLLDSKYEHQLYQHRVNSVVSSPLVKDQLFGGEWGDVYMLADAMIDTYFSLVTETVADYPHSFRTEKTWKPIMAGHPWITVANQNFYKDIRNLGFKTFDSIIDERFDQIANTSDRISAIIATVQDLLREDLTEFLAAAEPVCKYNQQHLEQYVRCERAALPQRFVDFVKEKFNL